VSICVSVRHIFPADIPAEIVRVFAHAHTRWCELWNAPRDCSMRMQRCSQFVSIPRSVTSLETWFDNETLLVRRRADFRRWRAQGTRNVIRHGTDVHRIFIPLIGRNTIDFQLSVWIISFQARLSLFSTRSFGSNSFSFLLWCNVGILVEPCGSEYLDVSIEVNNAVANRLRATLLIT